MQKRRLFLTGLFSSSLINPLAFADAPALQPYNQQSAVSSQQSAVSSQQSAIA